MQETASYVSTFGEYDGRYNIGEIIERAKELATRSYWCCCQADQFNGHNCGHYIACEYWSMFPGVQPPVTRFGNVSELPVDGAPEKRTWMYEGMMRNPFYYSLQTGKYTDPRLECLEEITEKNPSEFIAAHPRLWASLLAIPNGQWDSKFDDIINLEDLFDEDPVPDLLDENLIPLVGVELNPGPGRFWPRVLETLEKDDNKREDHNTHAGLSRLVYNVVYHWYEEYDDTNIFGQMDEEDDQGNLVLTLTDGRKIPFTAENIKNMMIWLGPHDEAPEEYHGNVIESLTNDRKDGKKEVEVDKKVYGQMEEQIRARTQLVNKVVDVVTTEVPKFKSELELLRKEQLSTFQSHHKLNDRISGLERSLWEMQEKMLESEKFIRKQLERIEKKIDGELNLPEDDVRESTDNVTAKTVEREELDRTFSTRKFMIRKKDRSGSGRAPFGVTDERPFAYKRTVNRHTRDFVEGSAHGYATCDCVNSASDLDGAELINYIKDCVTMSKNLSSDFSVMSLSDWDKLENLRIVRSELLCTPVVKFNLPQYKYKGDTYRETKTVCMLCELVMNQGSILAHSKTLSHVAAIMRHPDALTNFDKEVKDKVVGQMFSMEKARKWISPPKTDETVAEIGDAATEVKEAAAEIKQVVVRSEEKIENATKALEEIASVGKMFKEFFTTTIPEKVRSIMKPHTLIKYVSKLTGLALAVWVVQKIDDPKLQMSIVASTLLTSGIAYELISGFIKSILYVLNAAKNAVIGQAGDEKGEEVQREGVIDTFLSIFTNMFRKITPAEASITTKRYSLVKAYAGALKMVKDGVGAVFHYFKYVCMMIYELWTGHPYIPEEMKEIYEMMTVWLSECCAVMKTNMDFSKLENRQTIKRLVNVGDEIEINIVSRQMVNSTVPVFMDTIRRLREVEKYVRKKEVVNNDRVKPIFLHLCGEKNTGKTILADYLAKDLHMAVKGRKLEKADIYPFNYTEEFWEGYDKQWFMLMDDYLQSPVAEDRRRVMMQIIRCCNDAPYYVPMAFATKGEVPFVSRLIIGTSNGMETPGMVEKEKLSNGESRDVKRDGVSPYLQDPRAFTSRKSAFWRISNINDIKSKNRGMKAKEFTRDVYLIEEVDIDLEKPTGVKYTYAEALKILIDLYIENERSVGNALDIILKQEDPYEIMELQDYAQSKIAAYTRELTVASGKEESDGDLDTASEGDSVHGQMESEHKEPETPRPKQEDQEELSKLELSMLAKIRTGVGQLTTISPTPEDLSKFEHPSVGRWVTFRSKVLETVKCALKALAFNVAEGASLAIQMIIAMIGAFTGILIFGKFIEWMNWVPKPVEEVNGQSGPVALKTAARGKKLQGPGRGKFKVTGQSAPGIDNSAMDLAKTVLVKNIAKVKTDGGSVYCTFLFGRTFVTAKHVWVNNTGAFTLKFLDGTTYVIQPHEREIFEKEGDDQSFVTISQKGFPEKKDITSHILRDADFDQIGSNAVALVAPTVDEKTGVVTVETRIVTRAPSQITEMKYKASRSSTHIAHNMHTLTFENLYTRDGECGLPYILLNSKSPRKIFGIHVAGGAYACASLISQESFAELRGEAVAGQMAINGIEVQPKEKSILDYKKLECGNVEIIGTVEPRVTVQQPGKSEKAPTPIAGLFHSPVADAPALLKPYKGVSPMQVALEKKLLRPKNNHTDNKAKIVMEYLLERTPEMVEPRVLTKHEAINGVAGWHHFKQMEMDTSPGWPYNTQKRKTRGKKDWFTAISNPDGSKTYIPIPELDLKIDLLLSDLASPAEKLENYEVVYADCLKDEVLPMKKVWKYYVLEGEEKVEIDWEDPKWKEGHWNKVPALRSGPWVGVEREAVGDTRIMGPAAIEVLIVERMYFGAFFENLLRWQPDDSCPFDLGINPHKSGSWRKVFRKLTRGTGKMLKQIAGDVKKMDGSLGEFLQMWSCDMMLSWYRRGGVDEEELRRARKMFYATCVNVLHIAINLLYKTTGNPSGKFSTTMVNSLVFYLLIMLTALNTADRISTKTVAEILDYVHEALVVFGDDHCFGMDDRCWFDMKDLREECAKFGMVYTGIFKDKEMPDAYEFTEIKYLQRYFNVSENGEVHGALDKRVIETILDWYTVGQPVAAAMQQSGSAMLMEAFHWGHDYFMEMKEKLNRALAQKGYPGIRIRWHDLHASYYGFKTSEVLKDIPEVPGQEEIHGQMSDVADVVTEITDAPQTVESTTSFTDNSGKTDAMAEILTLKTSLAAPLNPYADQGLTEVLSRPYPIGDISWSSNDPAGTTLWNAYFPSTLTALPNLSEKLNRFQYGRFPVEVRFVLQGLMTYQGRARIVYISGMANNNSLNQYVNPFSSFWGGVNLPYRELSANTSVTAVMNIPWVGPLHYWNMKDDETDGNKARGISGFVNVYVYHPLRLTGATNPVSIKILAYARFINPEVAGYGYRVSSMTKSAKHLERIKRLLAAGGETNDEVFGQMDSMENEQLSRSMAGVNTHYAKAKTHAKASTEKFSIGAFAGKAAMGGAEALGGMLAKSLFLDKPLDVSTTSKMIQRPTTSFALASGVDGAEILAMHIENHVATDPTVYTTPVDYMLANNYIQLPYVVKLGSFDDTTVTDTRVIDIPVHPMFCKLETITVDDIDYYRHYLTYLANWTKGFRYWTGSIKYKLVFTCSSLVSARVRIAWVPDPTYSAALVSDEDGDVINKVFDIKGDTTVTFNIPYLREKAWLPVAHPNINEPPITTWDYFNGQLIVSVKVPPTCGQPDGTPTVDFGLEMAGGEDFRCAVPVAFPQNLFTQTPGTLLGKSEVHGQMESTSKLTMVADNRDEFRQPFEGLTPATSCVQTGVTMGEEVTSWPEYLKRYTAYSTNDNTIEQGVDCLDPWNLSHDMTTWNYHKKCWLFHRGSLRFKAMIAGTSGRVQTVWFDNTNVSNDFEPPSTSLSLYRASANGLAVFDSDQSPISEVQMPFYYDCNMISYGSVLGRERLPNIGFKTFSATEDEATTSYYLFISVGDDYTCGYPLPPPPVYSLVHTSAKSAKPNQKAVSSPGNSGMAQISLSGKATPELKTKRGGNNNTK